MWHYIFKMILIWFQFTEILLNFFKMYISSKNCILCIWKTLKCSSKVYFLMHLCEFLKYNMEMYLKCFFRKFISKMYLTFISEMYLKKITEMYLKSITEMFLKYISEMYLKCFSEMYLKCISEMNLNCISELHFSEVECFRNTLY